MKYFSLILLSSFLCLQSCDRISSVLTPNWLLGDWVIDREKTVEAFSRNNQRNTPAGGIVGEFAAATIRKSYEAMVSSRENLRFSFNETDMIDAGIKKTYEIVSRSPEEIKIVDSNDVVRTYHKEGEHIWFLFNNNENFQVYLKPATAR